MVPRLRDGEHGYRQEVVKEAAGFLILSQWVTDLKSPSREDTLLPKGRESYGNRLSPLQGLKPCWLEPRAARTLSRLPWAIILRAFSPFDRRASRLRRTPARQAASISGSVLRAFAAWRLCVERSTSRRPSPRRGEGEALRVSWLASGKPIAGSSCGR